MWQAGLGIVVFVLLAWAVSEQPRKVSLKTVAVGVALQLITALVLLKLPFFRQLFAVLNRVVLAVEAATRAGTSLVFGYLGGAPLPYEETVAGASFILAFRALPLVVVISALSSLLFYWRVLPRVVKAFAWCLSRTMGLGGTEGLAVAANVFVGMVEAPLFVRPYLTKMTRSELFTLMTAGMATIAGTVMILYATILGGVIPDVMGHILTASLISVPAAVTIAKIMIPETGKLTGGDMLPAEPSLNSMDAITRGTLQGASLLINIMAMLVVLVALVHLVNLACQMLPDVNGQVITLQRVLGWVMSPVVWLMGISWHDAPTAGALLGTKTVLNEFIAYLDLARLPSGALAPRSMVIMTYALCGFANPGSLGIMIGGLGTMAPERRGEVVTLGLRSVLAGTLAACMTGAVVGIIGG